MTTSWDKRLSSLDNVTCNYLAANYLLKYSEYLRVVFCLSMCVSADFSFWKMTRIITYLNFHEYMTINLLCLPQSKVNYILYHFSVTQYLKKFSLAPEFSEVRNTLCSSKCLQLQLSLLMLNAWISLHSAREELLRVPLLCLVCSTDKIILWRLHRILCLHFDGSSYSFN